MAEQSGHASVWAEPRTTCITFIKEQGRVWQINPADSRRFNLCFARISAWRSLMYDITVGLAVFVSPVQYYCEAYGVTKQSFASLLSLMHACGVRLQGHSRGNRQNVEKIRYVFLNYKFRMLMKLHFIIMSLWHVVKVSKDGLKCCFLSISINFP